MLIHSHVRTHHRLVRLLRTARSAALTYSHACRKVNNWMAISAVFFSVLDHSSWTFELGWRPIRTVDGKMATEGFLRIQVAKRRKKTICQEKATKTAQIVKRKGGSRTRKEHFVEIEKEREKEKGLPQEKKKEDLRAKTICLLE